MSIYLTGSIAFDYLMSFPGYFKDHILPEHLESISLSFLVDDMVRRPGGVAANIAYTLGLLCEYPKLVATAGVDFTEYRQTLEGAGVDTSGVRIIEDKFTASFFVNTDRSNAQIASFYAGAMADAAIISMHDLGLTADDIVVISPNAPDAMVKYAQECQELNVPYIFDPSQQIIRLDEKDLVQGISGAHALFVNEYEFELLQKHSKLSAEEIINQLSFVVITLSEQGSRVIKDGKFLSNVPAFPPKQILDPTGVGDAFRAGFLKGYVHGLNLVLCAQMGSLAATYSLEEMGPQTQCYLVDEFVNRFRTCFDDQGALDVFQ
ncbi:MAG TPA: carbohydrate kinase family protein [Brevefilum sp.]|nr:carbohydrate kinase family protein [Brevefilum sp.]HOR20126.1 carbohydrate kinase family protein [Brevefilum sp.]HPL70165.1 carbohydrate kinase family protein [Brevefilum sp.]